MRTTGSRPTLQVEMRMTWRDAAGTSADVTEREVDYLKRDARVIVDLTQRLHRLCELLKGYAKTGRKIGPDQLYALLDVMDEEFDQLVDVQRGVIGQIADAEPMSLLPKDPDRSTGGRTLHVVPQPA